MEFARPDRFVAGAAGEGEQRRFYIQIREGSLLATVAISRGQLTMLALHLGTVLDEVSRPGAADTGPRAAVVHSGPLEVPLFALFSANELPVGWDPADGIV